MRLTFHPESNTRYRAVSTFRRKTARASGTIWKVVHGWTGRSSFEAELLKDRERNCGASWQQRHENPEPDCRNRFYECDFVTHFDTIRQRIAATRGRKSPAWRRRLRLSTHECAINAAGSIRCARILEPVRKRDYEQVKRGAQAIYRAEGPGKVRQALCPFRRRWQGEYPPMLSAASAAGRPPGDPESAAVAWISS